MWSLIFLKWKLFNNEISQQNINKTTLSVSDDPLRLMCSFLDFAFKEENQNFFMKLFGCIFSFATFFDIMTIWDISLNESTSRLLGYLAIVVLQSQVIKHNNRIFLQESARPEIGSQNYQDGFLDGPDFLFTQQNIINP